MDTRISGILFIFSAAVLGGLVFYVFNTPVTSGVNEGSIALDIVAVNSNGTIFQLSENRGKKIVVEFMTTSCPYCVEELKDIKNLQSRKDVFFVSILLGEGLTSNDLIEFSNTHSITWFIGTSQKAGVDYKVTAVPTMLVIDSAGVIKYRGYYTSAEKLESVLNNIG